MPSNTRQNRHNARNAAKNNKRRVTRGNAGRSKSSAKAVNRHHAAATRRAPSPASRNRRSCVGKHCSSRRLGALGTIAAGFAGIMGKNRFNRATNTVKHSRAHNFGGPSHRSKSPKNYRTGKVPSNHKPFNTYNRNAAHAYQARLHGNKIKADVLGKKARRPTASHIAGRTK